MPNSVAMELDNVSKEGWVADGKITFRKSDGSPFICTYEATSRDKADEVKYRLNFRYFLWDCFAFGLVCATIGYVFSYETNLLWLVGLKISGNFGLLTGIGIIGFFSWYFTMQGWRKYRYIFAIQQFKQYFADEQWVALAADVFPSPNDPYLLELRNQCIYNGIGLAIVPLDGVVRKLIDPSRLGIFGRDRKITQWVTRAEWYQAFTQNVGKMASRRPKAPDEFTIIWNKIYRPIHYLVIDPFNKTIRRFLSKPLGQTTTAYNRFMSSQGVQKWVAFLTILVITPLFWRVITYSEEKVRDLKELQLRPNGINPEDQSGYLIEGERIPADGHATGVPKQYPIARDKKNKEESEDNTINLSGEEEDPSPVIIEKPKSKPKPIPSSVIPVKKVPDPCKTLQTSRGWFVQDNSFEDKQLALERASLLAKRGLPSNVAAQNCISEGRTGWLIWLGNLYPTESAAKSAAASFSKAFQRYGLKDGKFLVRKLR